MGVRGCNPTSHKGCGAVSSPKMVLNALQPAAVLGPFGELLCTMSVDQDDVLMDPCGSAGAGAAVDLPPAEIQGSPIISREGNGTMGRNPLQCPKCDMSYASRTGLWMHIRSVHDGVRHVCTRCRRSFPFRSGLTAHACRGTCDSSPPRAASGASALRAPA